MAFFGVLQNPCHFPLTAKTRVRVPLGLPSKSNKLPPKSFMNTLLTIYAMA